MKRRYHMLRELIAREYRDSDGYWIDLKAGWVIPGDAHGIVEDTKRRAYDKLKEAVPCNCRECRRASK
jgi:hypothetical protein